MWISGTAILLVAHDRSQVACGTSDVDGIIRGNVIRPDVETKLEIFGAFAHDGALGDDKMITMD